MNIVKNYILLPTIALLITAVIYILLSLSIYKTLSTFPAGEEIIWNYFFADPSLIIANKSRYHNIQTIVDHLPIEISNTPHKIKIIIKQDPYINAFAAPGNRIILTTGLLKSVKSENALLFIIGHEIGHLARKDHLYGFSKMLVAKYYKIITRSSLLYEILLLIDSSKSQETEYLMDIVALKILLHHYKNADGVDEVFKMLLAQENNKALSYTSSTHPQIRKRQQKIKELINPSSF